MGRLWKSLGKSAWGLGRDFHSHFDECSPNLGLPYKTGGKWTTPGLKVRPAGDPRLQEGQTDGEGARLSTARDTGVWGDP